MMGHPPPRAATMHDPTDALALHQSELARRPTFTAAEERVHARRVVLARRRYHRAALFLPHVARYWMAVCRTVAEDRLNADRNLRLTAAEVLPEAELAALAPADVPAAARAALLTRLAEVLPEVERLLAGGTVRGRVRAAKLLTATGPRTLKMDQLVREAAGMGEDVRAATRRRAGLDAARWAMAEGNLRLVVAVAKRYAGPTHALEDLIGWGHVGLMRAVDKFEPGRGNKFSTLAVHWINQAVRRAVAEDGRAVAVPAQTRETAGHVFWAKAALSPALGREPTWEEVSAWIKRERGKTVTPKQARDADRAVQPVAALDTAGDSEGRDGFVPADDAAGSDEECEAAARRRAVSEVLSALTHREREVLKLLYGLGDGYTYTLEEAGRVFSVTRERARQIQAVAIAKLRTDGVRELLAGHV